MHGKVQNSPLDTLSEKKYKKRQHFGKCDLDLKNMASSCLCYHKQYILKKYSEILRSKVTYSQHNRRIDKAIPMYGFFLKGDTTTILNDFDWGIILFMKNGMMIMSIYLHLHIS